MRGSLTIAETAARLGCSERKVFDLLKAGELRRAKSLGRNTLVRADTIEALEASLMPRVLPARALKSIPSSPDENGEAALEAFKKSLRTKGAK